MKLDELKIGCGLGDIVIGMTVPQVTAALGENYTLQDDEDEQVLFFEDLNVICTFWKDESSRLGIIETSRNDMNLLGEGLFGATMKYIEGFIKEELKQPISRSDSQELEDGSVAQWIDVDDSSLTFWFTDGKLSSISLSCQWFDDEIPLWPEE